MKPFNKINKKYFFLLILTGAICYGIGLTRGAFPSQWRFFFGGTTTPLRVLFANDRLRPLGAIRDFEKISGIQIEVQTIDTIHLFQSEAQNNDVVLAPFAWIQNQTFLKDIPAVDFFEPLLDQDFQSLKLAPQKFLPVFWAMNEVKGSEHRKNELVVWGIFSLKKIDLHPETGHFLKSLFKDPEKMAGWVLQAGLASTFKAMDARNDLSLELKPTYLRNFPLQQISIQK